MYVAECPEVGTVSQGKTIDEAVSNLKEATELYLEEFPVKEKRKTWLTTFEVAIDARAQKSIWRKGCKDSLQQIGIFYKWTNWFSCQIVKRNSEGKVGTVVPIHSELKIGTLKGILKLAKVDEEEFKKYI